MVVENNNKLEDYKLKKGNLNLAVIGHVEWINFLNVDQLPKPGVISHSKKSLELVLEFCIFLNFKIKLSILSVLGRNFSIFDKKVLIF